MTRRFAIAAALAASACAKADAPRPVPPAPATRAVTDCFSLATTRVSRAVSGHDAVVCVAEGASREHCVRFDGQSFVAVAPPGQRGGATLVRSDGVSCHDPPDARFTFTAEEAGWTPTEHEYWSRHYVLTTDGRKVFSRDLEAGSSAAAELSPCWLDGMLLLADAMRTTVIDPSNGRARGTLARPLASPLRAAPVAAGKWAVFEWHDGRASAVLLDLAKGPVGRGVVLPKALDGREALLVAREGTPYLVAELVTREHPLGAMVEVNLTNGTLGAWHTPPYDVLGVCP